MQAASLVAGKIVREGRRSELRLQPGQTVRAHKLILENLEWLGRGGNGSVYRMIITSGHLRGLIVAVKFLEILEAEDRIQRFEKEIELLQGADHPHIIEVLDTGGYSAYGRQFPFFVMEYQPRNLARELEAHPRGLHPDVVLPLCLQITSALVYLHSRNIIHRDLKPANVLFDGANLKVADFGIADLADRSGLRVIQTPEGEKVGPHFYMSPEQWHWWKNPNKAARPGPPSDIFQVGLIMYGMLTGFNPNTVYEWKDDCQPPPSKKLRDMDGSLVNDLVGIVREMVEVTPGSRPTAEKLQDRLLVVFRAYSSHFSALYGVRPGREF